MNKKILSILSIILLLFIGFFINIFTVSSISGTFNSIDGEYKKWGSPVPLMTNDKFIKIQANIRRQFEINKFILYFTCDQDNYYLNFGFVAESDQYPSSTFMFVPQKISQEIYDELKNYRYLKLFYNEKTEKIAIEFSNKYRYQEQYNNFSIYIDDDDWEAFYNFYSVNQDYNKLCGTFRDDSDIFKFNLVLKCDNTVDPNVINYLKATNGIIFKGEKNDAPYDESKSKNLYKYHNAVLDYKNNKISTGTAKFSTKVVSESWKILQEMMDIPNIDENTLEIDSSNDYDNRGYGEEFYKGSIDRFNKLLGDDVDKVVKKLSVNMDDNENNNISSKELYANTKYGTKPLVSDYFTKWFYYAGRYLYDDNLELFKKYYKYAYAMQLSEGSDKHLAFLQILENTGDLEKVISCEEGIKNDSCKIYCSSCYSCDFVKQNDATAANKEKIGEINSQACTQCMNSNEKYKKCVTSRDVCNKRCSQASTSQKDCFNGCMDTELGDYTSTFSDVENKLKDLKSGIVEKMISSTIKFVNAPKLNIDFGDGYEIKCEDVSFLHTIYMIMIIVAPILVIVLGSLDFFKAMLQSDEEKMKKFKKAFPKRIIMLILLILIPVIISFLVGKIDALNDTLMKCIVNG